MKVKFALRKILFISLPGLLIFLFLVELGLRAGGVLYLKLHRPETYVKLADRTKNTFNILCLGDSFTQGTGTSLENSYPKQLERLLQQNINKNIIVTNKGVEGNTSSLLLNNLEKEINKHNPRLIIIMVGINNRWNYAESSYFNLYRDNICFWDRLGKDFNNWRVYKLIKIISLRIKSKTDKDNMQDLNADRIRNILIANVKSDSLDAYDVGLNFYSEGKLDLARQKYIEALNIDSSNYAALLQLALIDISRKQYRLAKEEIWQAIYTVDSKAYAYYINVIFNLLDQLQDSSINLQFELIKLKEYLEENYKESNKKSLLKIIDAKLGVNKNQNILTEVIKYDLKEIIKISKNRGVAIILQTYPRNWYFLFNNATREISREYNIALVDNERIFEEEAKHIDIERFFVSDGHCNAEGYRIIAENIYKALIEHKFLSDNKPR